jgi:NAD(P)-dependent dehydrogenase (short-subunit alcohol dehydrogenase family)
MAAAYAASKAAVRNLTKSVAQHCAEKKYNIRCNSIHPGVVRTELWDRHARDVAQATGRTFEDILASETSQCPLGQLTRPQDVAAAAAFLASDDACFITGTQLIVDGGVVECESYRP